MSDVLSDDGSEINQDDSQEDVMTPAELIAKLEEVSDVTVINNFIQRH